MTRPEPAFEAPWHASVFAVTVALNEAGRFSWSEWVSRFSETLKASGVHHDLNGGDDYFLAWLETLEAMILAAEGVTSEDLTVLKTAWERAYLTTPHGQPVTLGHDHSSTSSISA